MVRDPLERRRDPRTPAHLPILLKIEDNERTTPAQLLDLSAGGAALITTTYNAPSIGQRLDLQFEMPGNDEDGEPRLRNETAIVMNSRSPERGVTRVGVRFIQRHGLGTAMFDPIDVLSGHRRSADKVPTSDRWDIGRSFDGLRKNRDRETAGTC